MSFRNVLTTAAVVIAATAVVPASAALVTFNAGDELATQFISPSGSDVPASNASAFVQQSTGGLADSGSLRARTSVEGISANGDQATHQTAFTFNQGDTFVTSILIHKVGNGAATGTTRAFQFGFTTNGTRPDPFTNASGTALPNSFISTRLNYPVGAGNYQIEIQHRVSGAAVTNLIPSGSGTNAPANLPNDWLLYSVTVQYLDSVLGTFAVSSSIQDYGSDGATPGAVLLSFTPTNITNGSLTGERTIYGGIRTFGNGFAEGTSFDNYSVNVLPIPEPASAGLLGVGAIALMARRRRI